MTVMPRVPEREASFDTTALFMEAVNPLPPYSLGMIRPKNP